MKDLTQYDLRCGNILNYLTSEGDWLPTVIDWQDLKWISEDFVGFNKVHKPIPLTKDWLIKLGFERIKDEKKYATDKVVYGIEHLQLNQCYENAYDAYFDSHVSGINLNSIGMVSFNGNPVKWVHQLQNLYFALTHLELKP